MLLLCKNTQKTGLSSISKKQLTEDLTVDFLNSVIRTEADVKKTPKQKSIVITVLQYDLII